MTATVYTKDMILAKIDAFVAKGNGDEWDIVNGFEVYLMECYLKKNSHEMCLTQVLLNGVTSADYLTLMHAFYVIEIVIRDGHYETGVNANMERLWMEHRDLVLMFCFHHHRPESFEGVFTLDLYNAAWEKIKSMMRAEHSSALLTFVRWDEFYTACGLHVSNIKCREFIFFHNIAQHPALVIEAVEKHNFKPLSSATMARDLLGSYGYERINQRNALNVAQVVNFIWCLAGDTLNEDGHAAKCLEMAASRNIASDTREVIECILFPRGIAHLDEMNWHPPPNVINAMFVAAGFMDPWRDVRTVAFASRCALRTSVARFVKATDLYEKVLMAMRASLRSLAPSFRALFMAYALY